MSTEQTRGPHTQSRRVRPAVLVAFAQESLTRIGMPSETAGRLAGYLVRADMRGVHSHGLDLLLYYWRGLSERLLNPTAQPTVIHRRGCVATIDGDNGLGYETANVGMRLAGELAHELGVGVVTARNSNHFGMAAHWPLQVIDEGLIGFATTNGPPALAHWGSRDVMMSNNPFAWGIPAARELPIILDAACSESARGKVRLAALKNEPIPDNWALGPDGSPTTDARTALSGALLPFGGPKGSGIAIVNEILSSALSGAAFLTAIAGMTMSNNQVHGSWGNGHFFMALDPSMFGELSDFLDRVDAVISQLRSASVSPMHQRIMMPGERGFLSERECEVRGLNLSPTTDSKLRKLARLTDMPVTW